jgi:ABC-type bacteriocin/lantibiotic exporter with double-glycine peptidase domain
MFKNILNGQKEFFTDVKSLSGDVWTILKYSGGHLKKYRLSLVAASLLKLLSFPIGIAIIYMTKNALDNGIFAKNMKVFAFMTVIGFCAYLIVHAVGYISWRITGKAKTGFSVDVNYDLAKRLLGRNYLDIRELSSTDNAFILGYDYGNIENLVFGEVPALITVVKIPVFFVLSAMISLPLTLLVFVAIPSVLLHASWSARKRKKYRTEELEFIRSHNRSIHDILYNLRLIKSYAKEDWALGRVMKIFTERVRRSFESEKISQKSHAIGGIFSRMDAVIFWLVGGYLVIKGNISFGSLSAVLMYTALILGELDRSNNAVQNLNEERPSIARCALFIEDLYAEQEQELVREASGDDIKRWDIEVKDLTFGYVPERSVFQKLSFVIPGSGWTLIRGVSGVGKTTLLSLMTALFDPWEGSILWGGQDLRDIDRHTFLKSISVVHQDSYILNDTLMDNILMGDPLREDDFEMAVESAKVQDLAKSLPSGYNSNAGESGSSFSGGQKQRIAIARALYRRPRVLVMDEATSFVDSRMEEDILGNIKTNYPRMRVIFVTHRDSAVKFADEVLVLEKTRMRTDICLEIKE